MLDPKLESLIAVQESGSFTRAAETLSLTQPAISQHVKQLEKELGVRLFFRSEGQLKPTEEGKIVLKYARRMMVLDQNLRVALEDHKRQLKRFSIGLTPTAENRAMTEVLAQYCNDHAGVHITILSDTINNLYNRLKSYELDAAVVEGHLNDPSLNSILLDTDSIMLAVSNESPLAKKSSVTLEELRRQPMILRLPSSGTRNLFVAHLESRGLHIEDFNVILEVDNIATIKDLVRSNFGVSILARSACMDELRKGKITLRAKVNIEEGDNDKKLIEACRRSGFDAVIRDWDEGFDTYLGRTLVDDGKSLSGGQWQLLGLTRAYFRDAPIIVLDEPSASLDPIAEHRIFNQIYALSAGKSSVTISHRLSNTMKADKILVLQDGAVQEQGSHAELMELGGLYAHLFTIQAKRYE